MASLSPYAFVQELDDNGAPLAAGLIYTYAAGTSTPKATYKDASGLAASLNTNPIVLSSAGRADIWLDNGGYKFVIKTAAGVTIKTVDGITGSGTGSIGFVSTMADLRALQSGAYDAVYLAGYNTAGDGGGGQFYWSPLATALDDKGAVIVPDSNPTSGRWVRITDKYSPEMFGSDFDFITWAESISSISVSIVINSDLDLDAASTTFGDGVDLSEFNNRAKIKNGEITINKMSARPMHQCFDDTLTVHFLDGAIREGNTIWFGTGAGAYTKFIAAAAAGNIPFIDDNETDGRNTQKLISDGVVLVSPLFNPLET